MKSAIIRLMAAALILILASIIIAGCKDESGSLDEPPEYKYVTQTISRIDDIGKIESIAYYDGKVYFTTHSYELGEEVHMWNSGSQIYSMNIDGTDFMELPNYAPPTEKDSGILGGFRINSICIDDVGNLWVVERWDLYAFDLSEDSGSTDSRQWNNAVTILESGNAVRKLDLTGAELSSVDISAIAADIGGALVDCFTVVDSKEIYIGIRDFATEGISANLLNTGTKVYVLNNQGNVQFQVDVSDSVNSFIRLPDRRVAFTDWAVKGNGDRVRVLQPIDFEAKALGDAIEIPDIGLEIYPGGAEHDIVIRGNEKLYGFSLETGKHIELLNWFDSGIPTSGYIGSIIMISDGRILCTFTTRDVLSGEERSEIIVLSITQASDQPEKIELTLATFYKEGIQDAVMQFNNANRDYHVEIIDYEEYNTDDDLGAGYTRFSTEIISGKVPDIIHMSYLPYRQYAAKGFLEDLYSYIDSDPEFSRNDFVEGAFRAAEVDGGLYQIFPSFSISALAGNRAVIGDGMGWDMDEFMAVLDANPDADIPLGYYEGRRSFLLGIIANNADEYIDWDAGTAHFDTANFMRLLEFVSTLSDEEELYQDSTTTTTTDDGKTSTITVLPLPEEELQESQLIATGRQIMTRVNFGSDFWQYQHYKALYGGEIALKGYPSVQRNGISLSIMPGLAIPVGVENKEGAWEFLRSLLDKDNQLSMTNRSMRIDGTFEYVASWDFPTNRAAFDAKLERAMIESVYNAENVYIGSQNTGPKIEPVTQADVDYFLALIDAASGIADWRIDVELWNIINEGAQDYFNGKTSVQDAARIIQSRASIFVSEQST